MRYLTALLVLVFACACTPAGGGGGGDVTSTTVAGSCPTVTRWAMTDSLGHPLDGKTGWIWTPTQRGLWADYSKSAASAADRAAFALNLEQTCTPSEIVLEAGVNDLGTQTVAQLEATVTNFVANANVPVRVVAITPVHKGGVFAWRESERVAYNAWLIANYPGVAIDCNAPLQDADGWLLGQYSVDSYLHLTNAGYLLLGNCIAAGA
jgi:hypothetical protein